MACCCCGCCSWLQDRKREGESIFCSFLSPGGRCWGRRRGISSCLQVSESGNCTSGSRPQTSWHLKSAKVSTLSEKRKGWLILLNCCTEKAPMGWKRVESYQQGNISIKISQASFAKALLNPLHWNIGYFRNRIRKYPMFPGLLFREG